MEIKILASTWSEHELLDSGNRMKLERFGKYVLVRSEPKAWWKPALPESEWAKATARNDDKDRWAFQAGGAQRDWILKYGKITFQARMTDMSKHVGVFPEQSPHWDWIQEKAQKSGRKDMKLLNLFGYTGAATLAAAASGFAVTHVDASKPSVGWAKTNQEMSNLASAPVRWILDDAVKFVRREIRRNSRYDAIVLDPPSFGRGPDGEVWKAETSLPELMDMCRQVLTDNPLFIILTMYNLEASSIMLGNILRDTMRPNGGNVSFGELALKEKSSDRSLPMSIYARWDKISG
jgi:23S rRNA (cytosine1962-C5)-methyltransferase